MKRFLRILLLGSACLSVNALPAAAQKGFALKGHYIYNHSTVSGAESASSMSGFGLGAEYVLPFGLGFGVSGYTEGRVLDVSETSNVVGLLEANYFLRLPLLPVAPYAGVHAAVGSSSWQDLSMPDRPRLKDTHTGLGYQLGLRFQPLSFLGLDAQYRRVSDWARHAQDDRLERGQLLIGVTLF